MYMFIVSIISFASISSFSLVEEDIDFSWIDERNLKVSDLELKAPNSKRKIGSWTAMITVLLV